MTEFLELDSLFY